METTTPLKVKTIKYSDFAATGILCNKYFEYLRLRDTTFYRTRRWEVHA